MITLSNGHSFEYMVASGALAFDGRGWPWERPLAALGFINQGLFTVVIKTLTRNPRPGNLRWWKPWTCVRLIPGGSVNKVGLTNPGIEWWCREIGPHVDSRKISLVGSIFGEENELVEMAKMLNPFDLVGLEINPSCPNTGHALQTAETIVRGVKAVKRVSRLPLIVKVSIEQDYLAVARWLEGVAGRPAQKFNWPAVEVLARQGILPVIGPSVMEYEDLERVRKLGASAISFGAIHLRTPWRPTAIVRKEVKI